MIPETNDARRLVKRSGIVLLIVTVVAMGVIRTISVRHRSRGPRESVPRETQQANHATSPADAGSKTRDSEPAGPPSAFDYVACAGNEIRIDGSDGGDAVVVGDLHNNAWRGGAIRIDGESDVYGRVTSTGTITIGSSDSTGPAVVHGTVKADTIEIGDLGEVRGFENLNEGAEGVDLDRDGDLDDFFVGNTPAAVEASRHIVSGDDELSSGDTDRHISDGTQPVDITGRRPGPVSHPYPDFRTYYEMVTDLSRYPPEEKHVSSDIAGDGGGHYFASASVFLAWINSQKQVDVLCWRCAGDGQIDPDNSTNCPTCEGTGKTPAVEIAGVFYVDDETLDLNRIETNLVVHGTIVVAEGNPYRWPTRSVRAHGGTASIDHFPSNGSLTIGGPTRMHFTQTHRSDREGGPYIWRHRIIRNGNDQQYIPVVVPEEGHAMGNFPAVIAASGITLTPRTAGFASFAGDVGDEAATVIRGVLFAGGEIRLGGRGGWKGDPIVFDENESRSDDDILDEAVLRIDLNDDGDVLDLVKISDISGRPVIPVARGRYTVDINNDGVLRAAVIGEDYGEFFSRNGYTRPILVYHEGTLLAETIRIGGQCAVLCDPPPAGSAPLIGFGASPGADVTQALLPRKVSSD